MIRKQKTTIHHYLEGLNEKREWGNGEEGTLKGLFLISG